jgi:O-antigen ligase/tetratricopeptide (TPR) repeat protein
VSRKPSTLLLLVIPVATVLYVSPSAAYLTYDAPKELILLAGAALLLIERLVRAWRGGGPEDPPRPIDGTTAALGALILVVCIAALRAHDGALAIRRVGLFVAGFVLFIETRSRIRDVGDLRRLLLTLTATGTVVALYGVIQYYIGEPFDMATDGLPVSTLGNPNFAGSMVAMLIPAAIAMVIAWRRDSQPVAPVGLVLMILHLGISKNRAGMIGLGVGVLAGLALRACLAGRIRAGRRAGVMLLATVVPAILFLVVVLGVDSWPASLRSLTGRTDTIRVRNLIWSGTSELVTENPALGQGLTDFMAEYPRVRPREEFHISLHRDVGTPHNDLLELSAEAGIPAALLLLLAVVMAVRAMLRRKGDEDRQTPVLLAATLAGVVAFLVTGLASSPLSHPGHVTVFFLLLGASQSLNSPAKNGRFLPPAAVMSASGVAILVLLLATVLSYRHMRCEAAIQASQRKVTRKAFIDLIADAVAWEPGQVDAQLLHGRTLARLGEDGKARKAFLAILDVQPNHVGARNELGSIAAGTNEFKEAMEWYAEAFRINPDFVPTLRNMARLYDRSGKHEDAAKLLNHAVLSSLEEKRDELRPELVTVLARAKLGGRAIDEVKTLIGNLQRDDRPGDARRCISWIIERVPDLTPAMVQLATRWAEEGQNEGAELILSGLVSARAATGDVWTTLEKIALERGDKKRARVYLAKAKLSYALEAIREGDVRNAEGQLRRASERGAPEEDVLYVVALIQMKKGEHGKALEILKKAAVKGLRGVDRLMAEEGFEPIRGNHIWYRILRKVQENE